MSLLTLLLVPTSVTLLVGLAAGIVVGALPPSLRRHAALALWLLSSIVVALLLYELRDALADDQAAEILLGVGAAGFVAAATIQVAVAACLAVGLLAWTLRRDDDLAPSFAWTLLAMMLAIDLLQGIRSLLFLEADSTSQVGLVGLSLLVVWPLLLLAFGRRLGGLDTTVWQALAAFGAMLVAGVLDRPLAVLLAHDAPLLTPFVPSFAALAAAGVLVLLARRRDRLDGDLAGP